MSKEKPVILAIESSCDETSAAVIENGKVLSNLIANQEIHAEYGGVVPELASRAHEKNIVPVVDRAMERAGKSPEDLDAIAFTAGPGLIGSLMVGTAFAKSMALSLYIPLIEVNHMQAHVLAHFIDEPKPEFPFLCLTVSGGHTQIVLVRDHLDMEVVGTTIDDAAGEAFDKIGKMFGLPYPAGPEIDKLSREGDGNKFEFAKPKVEGLNFSFSGLKTSVLYFIQDQESGFVESNMNDLCASLQSRIVGMLMENLEKAALKYKVKDIAIAGGVSANSELRKASEALANKHGWSCFIPAFQYCTDNAGMIAIAAHYKYLKNEFTGQEVQPRARYHF